MCWVLIWARSYIDYWNLQEPRPEIIEQWMRWPEHKWDLKYHNCLRCGAKNK